MLTAARCSNALPAEADTTTQSGENHCGARGRPSRLSGGAAAALHFVAQGDDAVLVRLRLQQV